MSLTIHVRNVADHVAVWVGVSVFIAGFGGSCVDRDGQGG